MYLTLRPNATNGDMIELITSDVCGRPTLWGVVHVDTFEEPALARRLHAGMPCVVEVRSLETDD